MFFYPRNKYLLVENVEEKPKDNSQDLALKFLMPDLPKKDSPTVVMRLKAVSPGSDYIKLVNHFVVVQSHLIETVKVRDHNYLVVPEHAVYGVFADEKINEYI